MSDTIPSNNDESADWSVVFVEENGDIMTLSDVHSTTILASAFEWFRRGKRTSFLLSRILYQFRHNGTLLPFDCNKTLIQLQRSTYNKNITIHVAIKHIVSRQEFDNQLADIDQYVKKNPNSFIGQQITNPIEKTPGNVMDYTKDETGGYFTISFLGDEEELTCPLDTFTGALREYYFDPTIDGFTQDLWWYLNEQILKYDSKLTRLDEDIKNLGANGSGTNELVLQLLKVLHDIGLTLLFSIQITDSNSYISLAGGVCPRASSCHERLKNQFRVVNNMKRVIFIFGATQTVNKPIFNIGDIVSAEWLDFNKRGVIKSIKGGVIKSIRKIKTTYGARRLYKVEFDNGITRDINYDQIGEHPEADWMGPSNWIGLDGSTKRNAPPKGVKHVCDKDSSDQWAREIGWYIAEIDGVGVPFVRFSDATRASDINTVLKKGIKNIKQDDLNMPEDWSISTKSTEQIILELNLLIAVERLVHPMMIRIGRVLIYLIHPGGNVEEKANPGRLWKVAHGYYRNGRSAPKTKERLFAFGFRKQCLEAGMDVKQICRYFIGAKGEIDKFLLTVPLFHEAYKAASPLRYLTGSKPKEANEFLMIQLNDDTHTIESLMYKANDTFKELLTKYAEDKDTSIKSLRIKHNDRMIFLSSMGKETPRAFGIQDYDTLEITVIQSTPTETSTKEQPNNQTSPKGKNKKKKKHKKSKKKQPVQIAPPEDLKGEHSKLLGKVYEEAESQFKEIRQRLNALNLERTKPKQRTSPTKSAKPVEVVDIPLDDGQLGGKAGKTQFIIQVGEVSNLYKTTKPSSASRGRRQDDIMIDLHGLTAEEAVCRLDKHLPSWIEIAMKGTYPFVIPVKIVCGGGNQILAEVVENWIKQNDHVANAPKNMYLRSGGWCIQ